MSRKRHKSVSSRLKTAYSYRIAKNVQEVIVYEDNNSFPICPRCKTPLEREYQAFCDRCGQRLGWNNYLDCTVCFMLHSSQISKNEK